MPGENNECSGPILREEKEGIKKIENNYETEDEICAPSNCKFKDSENNVECAATRDRELVQLKTKFCIICEPKLVEVTEAKEVCEDIETEDCAGDPLSKPWRKYCTDNRNRTETEENIEDIFDRLFSLSLNPVNSLVENTLPIISPHINSNENFTHQRDYPHNQNESTIQEISETTNSEEPRLPFGSIFPPVLNERNISRQAENEKVKNRIRLNTSDSVVISVIDSTTTSSKTIQQFEGDSESLSSSNDYLMEANHKQGNGTLQINNNTTDNKTLALTSKEFLNTNISESSFSYPTDTTHSYFISVVDSTTKSSKRIQEIEEASETVSSSKDTLLEATQKDIDVTVDPSTNTTDNQTLALTSEVLSNDLFNSSSETTTRSYDDKIDANGTTNLELETPETVTLRLTTAHKTTVTKVTKKETAANFEDNDNSSESSDNIANKDNKTRTLEVEFPSKRKISPVDLLRLCFQDSSDPSCTFSKNIPKEKIAQSEPITESSKLTSTDRQTELLKTKIEADVRDAFFGF